MSEKRQVPVKPKEHLMTVTFTGDHLHCESLMVLDELLQLQPLAGETLYDGFLSNRIPAVLHFWLQSLADLGAFDEEYGAVEWAGDDFAFMCRLWDADRQSYANTEEDLERG